MYSSLVIASQLVNKSIAEGKPVTQMKLQKMVYIAHGLHLAIHGEKLINEHFSAWKFGPVIPQIYNFYRGFGSQPITTPTRLELYSGVKVESNLDVLCESAEQVIEMTWNITKNVDALKLSNWTHLPDSPWYKAFNEAGCVDFCDATIKNDEIKRYFTKVFKLNAEPTTAD